MYRCMCIHINVYTPDTLKQACVAEDGQLPSPAEALEGKCLGAGKPPLNDGRRELAPSPVGLEKWLGSVQSTRRTYMPANK